MLDEVEVATATIARPIYECQSGIFDRCSLPRDEVD